jgi:hypothetical protein
VGINPGRRPLEALLRVEAEGLRGVACPIDDHIRCRLELARSPPAMPWVSRVNVAELAI